MQKKIQKIHFLKCEITVISAKLFSNRASVVWADPHQQSLSVFSAPVGSPAFIWPPAASVPHAVKHWLRAVLYLLSRCSSGPSLYLFSSAMPQARHGTAALFGGWLLDGTLCRWSWSGAKLLSVFTLTPLSLSRSVSLCLCHSLFAPTVRWHKEKTHKQGDRCKKNKENHVFWGPGLVIMWL